MLPLPLGLMIKYVVQDSCESMSWMRGHEQLQVTSAKTKSPVCILSSGYCSGNILPPCQKLHTSIIVESFLLFGLYEMIFRLSSVHVSILTQFSSLLSSPSSPSPYLISRLDEPCFRVQIGIGGGILQM